MLEAEIESISCNLQTLSRIFLEFLYKPKSIFSPGGGHSTSGTWKPKNYTKTIFLCKYKAHPRTFKSLVFLLLVYVFNHTEPKKKFKNLSFVSCFSNTVFKSPLKEKKINILTDLTYQTVMINSLRSISTHL